MPANRCAIIRKRPAVTWAAGSMNDVTAAVTPKGERRRIALVSAAADLLSRGRIRRCTPPCRRSPSRPSAGVDHVLLLFAGRVDRRCCRIHRNGRGRATAHPGLFAVQATARSRVDGRHPGRPAGGDNPDEAATEQLISRYERYIACARQPGLRDIQRRVLQAAHRRRRRGRRAIGAMRARGTCCRRLVLRGGRRRRVGARRRRRDTARQRPRHPRSMCIDVLAPDRQTADMSRT